MPLSHETAHDDQELIQYLLGLLPRDAADRLDEASVIDDDFAARLHQVEDDLVDAYVRGELSGDTLRRFEAHYLSSPLRRERVMFARTFVPTVDRAGAPVVVRWWRDRIAIRMSAFALAAVLLVACGALAIQALRLGRGLSVAESERVASDRRVHDLEQQVAALRAANADAAKALERARESVAAPASNALPIALVLMPQTRALGPVPTLSLPPGAERIRFDLRLESNDFPRYRVELRDPGANRIVWRGDWAAAPAPGSQPSVQVGVPAGVLKPQHYTLDLSGRGRDGRAEVVGSYTFQIVPR
jgi:hypothetical protein